MFNFFNSTLSKCVRCELVEESNKLVGGLCSKCDLEDREKHKEYQTKQFNEIMLLLDNTEYMKILTISNFWDRTRTDNLEQLVLLLNAYKQNN